MKRLPPLALAMLLAGVTSLAGAQTCGPLSFVFGTTGAGCAPSGGAVPTLVGALFLSPSVTVCPVQFRVTHAPSTVWILSPAFLIVGASNPILDLTPAGLPGCALLASPDAVVPMAFAAGGASTLTVPVPATPSLIGVTAFTQGILLSLGGLSGAISTRLSNGVSVSIL